MGKEENLKNGIKFSNNDDEATKKNHNASECGKKGGIASGEKKRADKQLKTIATLILNSTVKEPKNAEYLKKEIDNIEDEQVTRGALLLSKIFLKANTEDASFNDLVKALEVLRDTSGQKPVEKQEITNIDQDGYRRVLMDDEDIFAGDYGSADESDEEEEDKK